MTHDEILQLVKAQIAVGDSSGLASPQNSSRFIDLSRDQSLVFSHLNVIKDIKLSYMLDSLFASEPSIVSAVEGSAPSSADVIAIGRGRRSLIPAEFLLAYDITFDFLKRVMVSGSNAEQQINNVFAKRFSKDVLLVAFTGDTSLTGTTRMDKARKVTNGYFKRLSTDTRARVYDLPATPSYNSVVFPNMLSLLPKDYQDERRSLRIYCSVSVMNRYADEIGQRNTALGDAVLFGDWAKGLFYQGIELVPVPGLADTQIILTLDQNLYVGFNEYMRVGRQVQERQRVVEYTLTGGMDANYADADAIVYTIP